LEWEFKFNASGKFNTGIGGCPKCHRSGELNRVDYRNTDPSAVSVTIWNLHQIRIKYNEVTNSSIYSYNLSPKISAALRRGDHDFMANTPWEYVEAALAKKTLRLFPESVFHIRDTPLSGIATEGWGLPRGMANFRQAYLTQALKRLNMVMALDYSMPLRSLSPNLGGSGDLDPAQGLDLSDIGNKLSAIVADWRRGHADGLPRAAACGHGGVIVRPGRPGGILRRDVQVREDVRTDASTDGTQLGGADQWMPGYRALVGGGPLQVDGDAEADL
jgi:hypothetical protein